MQCLESLIIIRLPDFGVRSWKFVVCKLVASTRWHNPHTKSPNLPPAPPSLVIFIYHIDTEMRMPADCVSI